jgi:uncharacterized protein (TIGR02145 family)
MQRALRTIALFSFFLAACSSSESSDGVSEDQLREDAGPDAGDAGDAGSTDFVDPRDGKRYPTIRIGDKTWLAKNLDFAIRGSSWCYGDRAESCLRDGRLYTFTAAKTACPAGWRLGTDADWKSLEVGLGMRAAELDLEGYSTPRGTNEGTKAKSANGFAAKMAGFRTGSSYEARDDRTYFWTASTRGGDVWRRRVAAAETTIFRFTNPPEGFAISVRCVKD